MILYLLKANIVLPLFYLAYRFGLRRLTFYTINRFFLLAGIVFSLLYPIVDLTQLFKNHSELNNNKIVTIVRDYSPVQKVSEQFNARPMPAPVSEIYRTTDTNPPLRPVDYGQIMVAIFWAGVILGVLRLIIQSSSLYMIHRGSTLETFGNYTFRKIRGKVNPFSFWQTIYLNPDQHSSEELRAILRHEEVHIREWHSLDIFLAEFITICCWFNPFVWLMKRAVRENLEFIADTKVLQSGLDPKTYQYNLVHISSLPQSYAIVSNFNFLNLKKRILMMNKKQSSKKQVMRYLFLTPAIVILSLGFTVTKALPEKKMMIAKVKSGLEKIVNVFSTVSPELSEMALEVRDIIGLPDVPVQLLYIVDNVPLTKTGRVNGISVSNHGDVIAANPGDIVNITTLTDAEKLKSYGSQAANGAMLITTRQGQSGKVIVDKAQDFNSWSYQTNIIIPAKSSYYTLFVVDGVPLKTIANSENMVSKAIGSSPGMVSVDGRQLSNTTSVNGVWINTKGEVIASSENIISRVKHDDKSNNVQIETKEGLTGKRDIDYSGKLNSLPGVVIVPAPPAKITTDLANGILYEVNYNINTSYILGATLVNVSDSLANRGRITRANLGPVIRMPIATPVVHVSITGLVGGDKINGELPGWNSGGSLETVSEGYEGKYYYPGYYRSQIAYITTTAGAGRLAMMDSTKSALIPSRLLPAGLDMYTDKLVLKNIEKFETNSLWIFDKFGGGIFEKTNYQNDWNGKDENGHNFPNGKYYFILNIENGKKIVRGHFDIFR